MPSGGKYELLAPVTPYICSTPLDFKEEREWLASKVFPHLQEVCKARGSYLAPVDVCWSPEDTEVQDGHLLHLLLDCVKNSAPYFICLLGECYGPYNPEDSLDTLSTSRGNYMPYKPGGQCNWLHLNMVNAAQAGHSWVMKDGRQHCSFLELEIIAATFLEHCDHATFYFRQADHLEVRFPHLSGQERAVQYAYMMAENEHASLKIHALQHTIVKKGLPVRYFRTPQELGHLVTSDWIYILDIVCPPLIDNRCILDTEDYREWLAHQAHRQKLHKHFVTSATVESAMKQLTEFAMSSTSGLHAQGIFEVQTEDSSMCLLHNKKVHNVSEHVTDKTVLLVTGDRGVGKSALLSHWLAEIERENPDMCVYYHFVGTIPGDSDITSFLRRSICSLRRQFYSREKTGHSRITDGGKSFWSDENCTVPSDFSALCQTFVATASLGPCVVILDGINDLSSSLGCSQTTVKKFAWLPFPLPSQCRLILSTVCSDLTHHSLIKRTDVSVMILPGISHLPLKMLQLEARLKPHLLPYILRNQQQIRDLRMLTTPLAVCIVSSQVNNCYTDTQLNQILAEHADTVSLRAFLTCCLQQWINHHSWSCCDEDSISSKYDGHFDYRGWVAEALCLLGVSRGGLYQEELLQLLEMSGYTGDLRVTVLSWLHFRWRVGEILCEGADGRISFSHPYVRDAILYVLLRSISTFCDVFMGISEPQQSGKCKVHAQLADFFIKQPVSWRQLEELPWHLAMTGNTKELLTFLTHSRVVYMFLAQKLTHPHASQILQLYWQIVQHQGCSIGQHYIRLLMDLGLHTVPTALRQLLSQPAVIGENFKYLLSVQSFLSCGKVGREDGKATSTPSEPSGSTENLGQRSSRSSLLYPSILGGVPLEDQKNVLAVLAWGVHQFLQEVAEEMGSMLILTALTSYLQASFPLPVDTHLLLAHALENLGSCHSKLGNTLGARDLIKQALCLMFDLAIIGDKLTCSQQICTLKGVLLGHEAELCISEGDIFQGRELLSQALDILSHLPGNHALRARLLSHLGRLRSQKGETEKAEVTLRHALTMLQQWHGSTHAAVADGLLYLARHLSSPDYIRQHGHQEVEGLYRQALVVRESCFGSSHIKVAEVLVELGSLLVNVEGSQQAKMEAKNLLQRSLDISITTLGADNPRTLAIQESLRQVDGLLYVNSLGPQRPHSLTYSQHRLLHNAGNTRSGYMGKRLPKTWSFSKLSQSHEGNSLLAWSHLPAAESHLTDPALFSQNKTGPRSTVSSALSEVRVARCRTSEENPKNVWCSSEDVVIMEKTVRRSEEPCRQLMVSLQLGQQALESQENGQLLPHLQNFGQLRDGIIMKSSAYVPLTTSAKQDVSTLRQVAVRPFSAPKKLFQKYDGANNSIVEDKSLTCFYDLHSQKHRSGMLKMSSGAKGRKLSSHAWSADSMPSSRGHSVRCHTPHPHSIIVSSSTSVQGPNSHLLSLLGPPPYVCSAHTICHHRSACYHVPGRYSTSSDRSVKVYSTF